MRRRLHIFPKVFLNLSFSIPKISCTRKNNPLTLTDVHPPTSISTANILLFQPLNFPPPYTGGGLQAMCPCKVHPLHTVHWEMGCNFVVESF